MESSAPAVPIPEPLVHWPTTAEEVARWVGPDEPPSSVFWAHDLHSWRVIEAHQRWLDARRAWAAEHGLSYLDRFHPGDPATGRYSWS